MAGGNIYDKAKGKVKESHLNTVIVIGLIALAATFFILMQTSKGLSVNFETYGGSPVSMQRVAFRGLAEEPEKPHFEGKTFAGWYKDPGFKEPWDFAGDEVSQSTTLYAKWE